MPVSRHAFFAVIDAYMIVVAMGLQRHRRLKEVMIRRASALAVFAVLMMCTQSVTATVTINNDSGGHIGTYINRYKALRMSGDRVVVDGTCASACSMLLGVIPRNRICVTPSAVFEFHTAWDLSSTGEQVPNAAGNRILWSNYPADIRSWIEHHGGLGAQIISLSGATLARMFSTCK